MSEPLTKAGKALLDDGLPFESWRAGMAREHVAAIIVAVEDEVLALAADHVPYLYGHCDVGVIVGCDTCDWRADNEGGVTWAQHLFAVVKERSADSSADRPDQPETE